MRNENTILKTKSKSYSYGWSPQKSMQEVIVDEINRLKNKENV